MPLDAFPPHDPPQPPGRADGTPTADAIPDRVLFGRILALAALDPARPLTEALGLSREALGRLIRRHRPEWLGRLEALPAGAGPGEAAPEEADLVALLVEGRAGRAEEELWLAAILARRCRESNHLWQDLGLASRGELTALMRRHFPELVRRNGGDMKWKKFFYRQLCEREGVLVCRAPNCAVCNDVAECFGAESGVALLRA
jgi:nitrogen fixation protein NifQ